MGGCMSSDLTPEAKAAKRLNAQIEKGLTLDRKRMREETKILLLGTGESGKSTIFKQMKIISMMSGFSKEELEDYKHVVRDNCVSQMKVLLDALATSSKACSTDNGERAKRIQELIWEKDAWSNPIAEDIEILWQDPAVKAIYNFKDKTFQLNDSAAYFFDNVRRFGATDYEPSFQDVLRARAKTTGIEEANFDFEDISFKMLDVGGQRTERRKWIHCFEGVTAIIFCVAMSEYDQTLREDDTKNRMEESLTLWDEICNSQWFVNTGFILFLNKLDLFKEKIKRIDLKTAFPQYNGGLNKKNGKTFIKNLFLQKNRSDHEIFTHYTIAVDTEHIETVFKCVRSTILREILSDMNMF